MRSRQSTLQYGGIVVTTLAATKSLGPAGTANATIFYGNLAFATLTFGANGEIQTQTMPVFLYYRVVDGLGNAKSPDNQGVFGVNGGADQIDVTQQGHANADAAPTTSTICNAQSTTTCNLVSAMHYVNYGTGANAGFLLNPLTSNASCAVSQGVTSGSCTDLPYLTVGLNPSVKSSFSVVPLNCPGVHQPPGATTDGISACRPEISSVTLTVANPTTNGYQGALFSQTINANVNANVSNQMVLFDSGSATGLLNVPSVNMYDASGNPNGIPTIVPQGTRVAFNLPTTAPFVYSFNSANNANVVNPEFVPNTLQRDVIGFGFFTHHSFFIDLTANVEGFL